MADVSEEEKVSVGVELEISSLVGSVPRLILGGAGPRGHCGLATPRNVSLWSPSSDSQN